VAALRNQFGGHAVTAAEGSESTGADAPGADTSGNQSVQHGTDPSDPSKG
jgi:6-phosphogluconate dehydrogenase